MALDPATATALKYVGKKVVKKALPKILKWTGLICLAFFLFFVPGFMSYNSISAAATSCAAPTGTSVGGVGSYAVDKSGKPNESIIKIVYLLGKKRGVSDEVMKAAFITLVTETDNGPRNQASKAIPKSQDYPYDYLSSGNGTSIGIFQQLAYGNGTLDGKPWGSIAQIMDPSWAAGRFFDNAAVAVKHGKTNYADIAHAVQASLYPEKYQRAQYVNEMERQIKWAERNAVPAGNTTTAQLTSAGGSQTIEFAATDAASTTTESQWVWPVENHTVFSDGEWGPRASSSTGVHAGVDFRVGSGTEVHAANDGVVLYAGFDPPGFVKASGTWAGNVVVIKHARGINTVYAHNSSVKVHEGETVKANQVIALSGNTGRSFGPHVHFEVHINNDLSYKLDPATVDPVKFLQKNGAVESSDVGATPTGANCSSATGDYQDPGSGSMNANHLRPRAANGMNVAKENWGCATHKDKPACVSTIGGWRPKDAYPDHPDGRAIDIMVTSGGHAFGDTKALGDQISEFYKANARGLGVQYVIWNRHIWSVQRDNEGWRDYRAGMYSSNASQAHTNHVHVTFNP